MERSYKVTQACLDDWQNIQALWASFRNTRFSAYISGDLPGLEAVLCNSYSFPDKVAVLLLWETYPSSTFTQRLVGMLVLFLHTSPSLEKHGLALQINGFIHSVFIQPGVKARAGKILLEAAESWSAARGATHIFGNVRVDGNLSAFHRKYGFKPTHSVIIKEIDNHGQRQ